MDEKLMHYLERVKPVEDEEFLKGKIQTNEAFHELEEELQHALPFWIRIMLTRYPIAGLIIRFKAIDGKGKAIQFNGFNEISDNFYVNTPGSCIFPYGYFSIGEDPTGSGHPYFINMDEGNNPPVYQIRNDISNDGAKVLEEGKTLVAKSLSSLFKNQLF